MFKSLFTKYIVVFMTIITISFLVLALTICSMVATYASSANSEIVERAAFSAEGYLTEGFAAYRREQYGLGEFTYYVSNRSSDIYSMFESIKSVTGDTVIFITDLTGNVLLSFPPTSEGLTEIKLSQDIVNAAKSAGKVFPDGDLGGLVPSSDISCAVPISDSNGTICGVLVTSASSIWINELIEVIIKTVVMSSLWVMIAALIAVYYLTERVIGPMRRMRIAAKKFASGHFDVRVPVQGHDEVAELAVAFNNMATSLEKLEDLRSTFLANVSHDLRTPMTTISGFVDGIIEGIIPPEKQGHYLEIISVEVKRLSRLVSSLLDLSRIQAGDRKFVPTVFDICEMGRLILIGFEQKIEAKNLDVEFDITDDRMMAYADHDAVYQVFYNLCDNAVKFSREGGKYRISILDVDKKIKVSVYNQGQGIPLDDIPYVFERFYKSDKSRGLDKSGAGLGLFIAKTIMNSHGEDLTVDSVYGEYCEFSFTLKYATPAQIAEKAEQRKNQAANQ